MTMSRASTNQDFKNAKVITEISFKVKHTNNLATYNIFCIAEIELLRKLGIGI